MVIATIGTGIYKIFVTTTGISAPNNDEWYIECFVFRYRNSSGHVRVIVNSTFVIDVNDSGNVVIAGGPVQELYITTCCFITRYNYN